MPVWHRFRFPLVGSVVSASARLVVGWAALGLLAACGGGGGGGSGGGGGGNPPPRLPPSAYETEEYQANFGLAAIGAAGAYSAGATGQGIRVAVIDSGVDLDHPEFAGAIARDSVDLDDGEYASIDDVDGHGTAVAGVIAARKNDALTQGVAYEATLLVVRADLGDSCASGCLFDQADVAEATDYAVSHGARVVNYSIGGTGRLGATLGDALTRAVEDGALLVLSAGNAGADQPTVPARFAGDAAARGQAIAVGAVDSSNRIAAFSNRAGDSQDHFLVAPGVAVTAPALGGGSALVSGTSFAAPHVSGAAALLLQAAPHLSAAEVVELLLSTATDLGAPGPDPIYGQGLVDVGAALAPQGTLGVPLGRSVDGPSEPLGAGGLQLGSAFGPSPEIGRVVVLDAYGRAYWADLDGRVASVERPLGLDRWLAPAPASRSALSQPMAGLTLGLAVADPPSAGPQAFGPEPVDGTTDAGAALHPRRELRRDPDRPESRVQPANRFGLAALAGDVLSPLWRQDTIASPYLALADSGESLALGQAIGPGLAVRVGFTRAGTGAEGGVGGQRADAVVGELTAELPGWGRVGVQAGRVAERDGLLSAQGEGALRLADGAATRFVGLAGTLGLGDTIELFGQANLGLTDPAASRGGLFADVSTLRSRGFAVGVTRRGLLTTGDRLGLALAQPLRVESGSTVIDRPVGRTVDGVVLRRRERIDLAPDGRELDLELGYRLALAERHELGLTWLTRLEPGHDAQAPPSHAVALRLRSRF